VRAGDGMVSVHVPRQALGGKLDTEGKELTVEGWVSIQVKVKSQAGW
jgi:hypothetical protein